MQGGNWSAYALFMLVQHALARTGMARAMSTRDGPQQMRIDCI